MPVFILLLFLLIHNQKRNAVVIKNFSKLLSAEEADEVSGAVS